MPDEKNKPPTSQRPRAGLSSEKTDVRARWVMDRWDERPSLRYREMVAEVSKQFECGKTAGEQAIKRAYEMMKEEASNEHLTDRITAKYMSLAEAAERDGDWRAARSILDSLRRHLGLGAPDRVDVTVKDENMDDMTDEELAVLAKLDARLGGSGMTH